LSKPK